MGYRGSDDHLYARLAHILSQGQFEIGGDHTPIPVFPLRLGLLVPVAVFFKTFGVHPWSYSLLPMLVSLLLMIMAYMTGRLFFNQRAGFIALALIAFLPIDIMYSATLYSDPLAALWGHLAVVFLYAAYLAKTNASKMGWGIAAGLLIGLSWLCKISVVFLFPFLTLFGLWMIFKNRKNGYAGLSCLAGFAFILMAESFMYYHTVGDFLYRYHETERNYEISKTLFFSEGGQYGWEKGHYLKAVFKRIFYAGPNAILFSKTYGWLPVWGCIALMYSFFIRDRRFLFPGLWLLSLILIYNFGSSSLSAYRPLVLYDRYLFPLFLPSAILVAGFLSGLLETIKLPLRTIFQERVFWVLLVLLGLSYPYGGGLLTTFNKRGLFRELQHVAHTLNREVKIYTDNRTKKMLNFYRGFPDNDNVVEFQKLSAEDIDRGAHIILNQFVLDYLTKTYNYQAPQFCNTIPDQWRLIQKEDFISVYYKMPEKK